MPPKGLGAYPRTPAEKRDRDRVIKLVYAVGRDRLRFNTYHLQATARTLNLQLEQPSTLHRHLRALEGETVVQAGTRNQVLAGERAARYGKKIYVLKARESELAGAQPELDDLEKALWAVWVAVAVLGGSEVPTTAVTAVLKSIEDLSPESSRNTLEFLTSLHGRAVPLVQRTKMPGERIWRWLPTGPTPDDPRFEQWVTEFKGLNHGVAAVMASGHATVSGMAEELVRIAVTRTKSTTWPTGHPVTIRDLEATAGVDERAAQLTRLLRRRGTPPAVVLGDLTKEVVAGAPRVDRKVIKIQGPIGTSTYYDCPDILGSERRATFVHYEAVRMNVTSSRLTLLKEEYQRALTLAEYDDPIVHACATVRMVAVHREVASWVNAVDVLTQRSASLSKTIRESVSGYRSKLNDLTRISGCADTAFEKALATLTPLGLTVDDALSADRPLIVAEEYVRWFPKHMLNGLGAVDFLARCKTLSRYRNPHHTHRSNSDPRKAAATCVDRVEALLYAAEYVQSPMLRLFQSGAGLLGRFLRHGGLVSKALHSDRPAVRRAAFGALVMLADPAAEQAAWKDIENPESADTLADALHALLLLQRLDLQRIPTAVRQSTDPYVQSVLRRIVRAARQGKILVQS